MYMQECAVVRVHAPATLHRLEHLRRRHQARGNKTRRVPPPPPVTPCAGLAAATPRHDATGGHGRTGQGRTGQAGKQAARKGRSRGSSPRDLGYYSSSPILPSPHNVPRGPQGPGEGCHGYRRECNTSRPGERDEAPPLPRPAGGERTGVDESKGGRNARARVSGLSTPSFPASAPGLSVAGEAGLFAARDVDGREWGEGGAGMGEWGAEEGKNKIK